MQDLPSVTVRESEESPSRVVDHFAGVQVCPQLYGFNNSIPLGPSGCDQELRHWVSVVFPSDNIGGGKDGENQTGSSLISLKIFYFNFKIVK